MVSEANAHAPAPAIAGRVLPGGGCVAVPKGLRARAWAGAAEPLVVEVAWMQRSAGWAYFIDFPGDGFSFSFLAPFSATVIGLPLVFNRAASNLLR